MEKQGFKVYEAEWWHFDFHEWRLYPILNTRFEDLNPSFASRPRSNLYDSGASGV
jgi:hypothetical protein